MGVAAVLEAIDLLIAAGPDSTPGVPQDARLATRAPRLAKADGMVTWSLPADRIERMRRAAPSLGRGRQRFSTPEPSGRRCGSCWRMWLLSTKQPLIPAPRPAPAPGTILSTDEAGLVVACGENTRLVVRRLVPEGKRSMSAAEFLRGHALFADARFG